LFYIENCPFDELVPGQSVERDQRLTLDDLKSFATRAANANPERMDEEYATSDLFHRFLSHGMWATAQVAVLIVTELPGPGTTVLEQNLNYGGELAIGESIRIRVEVREKRAGNQVLLACRCLNERDEQVLSGTVLVRAPSEKVRRPRQDAQPAAGRRRQLTHMLEMAAGVQPAITAVVHPVDHVSLSGAVEAAEQNLIVPILIGPEERIRAAAEEAGIDLAPFRIIAAEHSHAAAELGVQMARNGEAEVLMKGALHTDELMGAVVNKEWGLRTGRRMSHVWVMDVPTYPRPLLISDTGLNIYPDLATKRDIVQNAIDLAHVLGIPAPKVAILSATESVNPDIRSTLDAAALCKMADRGQISGGILDGPLAFDNAISEAAAKTKGIVSPVAGRADILIAPDLDAGNMLAKQLHYLADADAAGIVMGARVPIVLTSRADDQVSRMASSAIALLLAEKARGLQAARLAPAPEQP
jgi:phosphate acetyltransferase/phosphate butyryltransferase